MDIVERLRTLSCNSYDSEVIEHAKDVADKAADEIEQLRKALRLVRRYLDNPAIEKALGEKE